MQRFCLLCILSKKAAFCMMKPFRIVAIFFLLMYVVSCDETGGLSYFENLSTVIDGKLYNKPPENKVVIERSVIKDGFMEIQIAFSGCDGSTCKARLIDSEVIDGSLPVQRYLRVEFINEEEGDSTISKTFAFDLTPLQVPEENKVRINLDGWNESLLYTY